jgi:hypothetical protein
VEKWVLKVLARFVLSGGALSRKITGMTYLYSLCLLILALWLASEIVARDLSSPAPKDPYRLDRWRKGEGDPDQYPPSVSLLVATSRPPVARK